MEQTVRIMMALFRFSLEGQPLPPWVGDALTPERADLLYELTKVHDLAHLAADALLTSGLSKDHIPAELSERFRKRLLKAIYRFERMHYEYERICRLFDKQKIPYIPLKGAVIRRFYPEPWMRTSVDIDILVRREDFSSALEKLEEILGYRRCGISDHDISVCSPDGIRLELHHSMLGRTKTAAAHTVLSHIWDYAHPAFENSFCYMLDPQMFGFLHIAHMAEHFEGGGCGVRPFLDLWLMKRQGAYDRKLCAELLSEGGLMQFAEACENLADVWMSNAPKDKDCAVFESYILSGGVYGSLSNMVAAGKSKKGGVRYIFSRLFLPYDRLKYLYPVLQKHKWLLPAMQVRRWAQRFSRNGIRRYMQELKMSSTLSSVQKHSLSKLRSYLGL